MLKLLAALFVVCATGFSQDPVPPDVDPTPPPYTPLDLGQKFWYSLDRITGPSALVGFAARAGLDQVWHNPARWRSDGSESLAMSAAVHFGDRLTHESIAFGVRALTHEDPRYFPSAHGTVWQRTRYAIVHTFEVRNDDGSAMPAYSLFVSSYATPAIVRSWHTGPFTLDREMRAGTVGLGVGVAQSLFREFSPDLRKHLPRRFR